jgi:hypothetical protein
MTRSLRVAVTGAVIFLIQASVPAYAQSSKPEAAIGNASYMVMAAPIGITPAQVARFNVSILASKGSAADFQGGCSWAGFIWFYDENDKTVGSPTTFTEISMGRSHRTATTNMAENRSGPSPSSSSPTTDRAASAQRSSARRLKCSTSKPAPPSRRSTTSSSRRSIVPNRRRRRLSRGRQPDVRNETRRRAAHGD